MLTAKQGGKKITVLSGKVSVPANASTTAMIKLSSSGMSALKSSKSLSTQVKFTSTTDQPGSGKTITLSLAK